MPKLISPFADFTVLRQHAIYGALGAEIALLVEQLFRRVWAEGDLRAR